MQVPDRIGEIIGYRAWYVKTSFLRPPFLESMNGQAAWPTDDWLYAECNAQQDHDPQDVPVVGCSCGIYAAGSRAELNRQWGYNKSGRRGRPVVIGEVGLAGTVIMGEKAHRAQKARVVSLCVDTVDWKIVTPLHEAYNVPVYLTNLLSERSVLL